ncbi:hypothetical protein HNR44_003558 [Geomicrobium halophilum]|uniref:Cxxc_20_cxxc protein n=1 Tax=Geomicrobium halophilum TaxID=549000 RepID=A0A841Q1E3_9BACL|nr:hypothetical protein [Geomicrobium halophilum]MBB6451545.1 hypothetical protein [Geomicrobium halophilum]
MAETNACPTCKSNKIWEMTQKRYIFTMSVPPLIVIILIAVLVEPVFIAFMPAIILTNIILAKRKAPILFCKECRHQSTSTIF